MNDKSNVDKFFDYIENNDSDVKEIETPEAMKSKDGSPPPSLKDIKDFESGVAQFEGIVQMCRLGLSSLPFEEKDYHKLEIPFSSNKFTFREDDPPSELSKQLCQIQLMKDDVVELMAMAHVNFLTRKRYMDILISAFNAISQQKTADKRRGDANLKLFDFIKGCSDAEAFYIKCKYYFDNIDSKHKTISRRITCMQAQMSIGDISTAGGDPQIEIKEDTEPEEVDWDSVGNNR